MRTTMKLFTKINFWLPVLLSLALAGCVQTAGGSGAAPPPSANQNAHADSVDGKRPPLPPAHPHTIRFWRDSGKSLDEETLAKIAGELADAIKRHKEEIVGVEVVQFAKGNTSVWAELPVKFIWGAAPEISEFKPDLDNAPPDAKLFKDATKKYIERERRKFEDNKALLLSDYNAHVDEQLKKFTDYLLQAPALAAPCTQFTPLAERMRMEDLPYSILITDGWADCSNEKGHVPEAIALRGRHVILQLTRHMDSQADDKDFLQRRTFLHQLFPTSEVMPASMPDQAIELIFR